MDEKEVLYSAVVLDEKSKSVLLSQIKVIPEGWDIYCHHMTIAFGKPVPNEQHVGKQVKLTVKELGISDMAIAVRVTGYPSNNAIPHITVAVNPMGGKPVMSNFIEEWFIIDQFQLVGTITNIMK